MNMTPEEIVNAICKEFKNNPDEEDIFQFFWNIEDLEITYGKKRWYKAYLKYANELHQPIDIQEEVLKRFGWR